jgi:hypothetical protein
VIDDRSQNLHPARRFRVGVRLIFLGSLTVFSCGWLWLYFDSVYQRQKAESWIADLKSFPFASAGFLDVRELAIHHGGSAGQQVPQLRLPHSGVPFLDSQGKVRIPRIPAGPICTAQDCTFEIWIKTRLARLPLRLRNSCIPPFRILVSVLGFSTRGLKSAAASWREVERQ